MANRIQKDYRSHMQGTSPDMDKLWNRIEQRIDNSQAAAKKAETGAADEQQKITVSKGGGWIKYAAVAACLIAVVVGTVTLMKSKENDIKTDTDSSYSQAKGEKRSATLDGSTKALLPEDTYENKKENERGKEAEISADPTEKDTVAGYDTSAAGTSSQSENTKTAENISTDPPEVQMMDLMGTYEYDAADDEQKLKMVTDLAQKLMDNGRIEKFDIVPSDKATLVKLTLTDGTMFNVKVD